MPLPMAVTLLAVYASLAAFGKASGTDSLVAGNGLAFAWLLFQTLR